MKRRKQRNKMNAKLRMKEYQVPQFKDKDGYLCVVLEDKTGDRVVKRIHELVALAHIPNPENKPKVKHKDGDITNNRADNLEWVDE